MNVVTTWFVIFQILYQYLQKAEPKRCEQFLRIHGFHLLANQVLYISVYV